MNRRIWLIFAFTILWLMASGCGGSGVTPESTTEPIPSDTPVEEATLTPELPATEIPSPTAISPTAISPTAISPTAISPTAISPLAILEQADAAMGELSSYHYELEMNLDIVQNGESVEMPFNFVGDHQLPDRTRTHMTLSFMGATLESDLVTVGDLNYMTNPDTGRWEEAVGDEFLMPGGGTAAYEAFAANPEDVTELTLIGEEELDGRKVNIVEGTIDVTKLYGLESGLEGNFTIRFWIDSEDFRVWKISNEGQMVATWMDSVINTNIEMVMSAFNEPVSVELPEIELPPSLAEFCQENPDNCISKGSDDAPLVLVEISDYGCSHCRNFNLGTADRIDNDFVEQGQIRDVVVPFALWPETAPAAVSAICAGQQNHFWEYHRSLFEMQNSDISLTQEGFTTLAQELELDMEAFTVCQEDQDIEELLQQNIAAVRLAEVNATPTFFLGEHKMEGNYPYSDFAALITSALEASGS